MLVESIKELDKGPKKLKAGDLLKPKIIKIKKTPTPKLKLQILNPIDPTLVDPNPKIANKPKIKSGKSKLKEGNKGEQLNSDS